MNYKEEIYKKIEEADVVVIGAGAGLSTAGGLQYSGERFENNFEDFIEQYGLTDMYSSGFYPFKTQEEQWAYWSRHAWLNRYAMGPMEIYENLFERVKDKNYFVLTTNADHQFFLSGFDHDRIFATQGDYGKIQCSDACHDKLYDAEAMFKEMVEKQVDCKVPKDLLPVCPVCGEVMDMNLRKDGNFVEDADWHVAHDRYVSFVKENQHKKILFLELGVGMNTPVIIKYPFIRMTEQLDHAFYLCLNMGQAYAPEKLDGKSLAVNIDLSEVF